MTYTPEMAAAGEKLYQSLMMTSLAAQDEALQDFLFALFTHKRCGTANKFIFPTYNFLIMYSFAKEGNLKPCSVFTQYFSKVIFFGRMTLFKAITAHAKREGMGFHE